MVHSSLNLSRNFSFLVVLSSGFCIVKLMEKEHKLYFAFFQKKSIDWQMALAKLKRKEDAISNLNVYVRKNFLV